MEFDYFWASPTYGRGGGVGRGLGVGVHLPVHGVGVAVGVGVDVAVGVAVGLAVGVGLEVAAPKATRVLSVGTIKRPSPDPNPVVKRAFCSSGAGIGAPTCVVHIC